MSKFFYAIDNGGAYSGKEIYLFECDEKVEVIQQIVDYVNMGDVLGSSREWQIVGAAEILRTLVPTGEHSFGSWLQYAVSLGKRFVGGAEAKNYVEELVHSKKGMREALRSFEASEKKRIARSEEGVVAREFFRGKKVKI